MPAALPFPQAAFSGIDEADHPIENRMPHATGKPRGRKALDPSVQEAVITAVQSLMAQKGPGAVKARAIAKAAGISVGSVYNMFGDLNGLIRRANARTYDSLLSVVSEASERAHSAGKPLKGRLTDLSDAYLDFVAQHQHSWLGILAYNRQQTEPAPDWYQAKELALLKVIEDALGDVPLARHPETRHNTARALWASIHGIVTFAVGEGFLARDREKVRQQIDVIVTGMSYFLEHPEISH